jgi:hypothetical protein
MYVFCCSANLDWQYQSTLTYNVHVREWSVKFAMQAERDEFHFSVC